MLTNADSLPVIKDEENDVDFEVIMKRIGGKGQKG